MTSFSPSSYHRPTRNTTPSNTHFPRQITYLPCCVIILADVFASFFCCRLQKHLRMSLIKSFISFGMPLTTSNIAFGHFQLRIVCTVLHYAVCNRREISQFYFAFVLNLKMFVNVCCRQHSQCTVCINNMSNNNS